MEIKAKSKSMADLKAYLEAERARLQKEIAARDTSTGRKHAGYGNHMADDATTVFEQAKSVGLKRGEELLLADVEDALKRMATGAYGVCRRCGQPIDPARLRVLPTASLCLPCQARAEFWQSPAGSGHIGVSY